MPCRPAHPSGARIETRRRTRRCRSARVAPLTRAGRGLKRRSGGVPRTKTPVAPLTRAGRGLKLVHFRVSRKRRTVAPLTRAGRGLKHTERGIIALLFGRPAHPSGARIETADRWDGNHFWKVAPLTRAGRGLKHVTGRFTGTASRRPAHPSGARIETSVNVTVIMRPRRSPRSPERGAD